MRYNTVFIDWNGTLSDSHFWDRWGDDSNFHERYQLIQDVLFHSEEGRRIIKDWMRGLRSVGNVLQYLHELTSIPVAELESELRYSCENMKLSDPRVIDTIRLLRANGVKVVIATDNMDVFQLWTVPSLKLDEIFDEIITSDRAGALKIDLDPDGSSPFFEQYLMLNNLKPGDSVILDDSDDTRILNKLGIDFLHVNQIVSLGEHLDNILANVS